MHIKLLEQKCHYVFWGHRHFKTNILEKLSAYTNTSCNRYVEVLILTFILLIQMVYSITHYFEILWYFAIVYNSASLHCSIVGLHFRHKHKIYFTNVPKPRVAKYCQVPDRPHLVYLFIFLQRQTIKSNNNILYANNSSVAICFTSWWKAWPLKVPTVCRYIKHFQRSCKIRDKPRESIIN